MKMKQVCNATNLTERAIRLYMKKGLVEPETKNGIAEFSAEDVRRLKDIGVLRRFDFSMEQIGSMLVDPALIPDALENRLREAEIAEVLRELRGEKFANMHEFAVRLEVGIWKVKPDFGRFDEIDDEQRSDLVQLAQEDLARSRRLFPWKIVLAVLIGLGVLCGVFLMIFMSSVRVGGYLPIGSCTILEEVEMRWFNTPSTRIRFDDEWTQKMLGRDTVVARVFDGTRWAEVGETVENVYLKVELTNHDLRAIGISPFQRFSTGNLDVDEEWMRVILTAFFDADPAKTVGETDFTKILLRRDKPLLTEYPAEDALYY